MQPSWLLFVVWAEEQEAHDVFTGDTPPQQLGWTDREGHATTQDEPLVTATRPTNNSQAAGYKTRWQYISVPFR